MIELVKGQRKASSRKFYPGYILVQMELNDETWHLVRHTAEGDRVSSAARIVPFRYPMKKLEAIIQQMEEGAQKPRPKFNSRRVMRFGWWTVLSPISTESSTK